LIRVSDVIAASRLPTLRKMEEERREGTKKWRKKKKKKKKTD
jgi:hypothetical protein